MRKSGIFAIGILIFFGIGCNRPDVSFTFTPPPYVAPNLEPSRSTTSMQLTSTAFKHERLIPSKYTCDGKNISPPLGISGVSSQAKSLVLIMEDPDVPAYADVRAWNHWVVFDIPTSTKKIAEGSQPQGMQGQGTGGGLTYTGPCPPEGSHRYFFKLYALDTLLQLRRGANREQIERAMSNHVIERTELMGTYERKN